GFLVRSFGTNQRSTRGNTCPALRRILIWRMDIGGYGPPSLHTFLTLSPNSDLRKGRRLHRVLSTMNQLQRIQEIKRKIDDDYREAMRHVEWLEEYEKRT